MNLSSDTPHDSSNFLFSPRAPEGELCFLSQRGCHCHTWHYQFGRLQQVAGGQGVQVGVAAEGCQKVKKRVQVPGGILLWK
jgi:DNA/RNA-binding domain of Phe-tRNA-synthetase-like protein